MSQYSTTMISHVKFTYMYMCIVMLCSALKFVHHETNLLLRPTTLDSLLEDCSLAVTVCSLAGQVSNRTLDSGRLNKKQQAPIEDRIILICNHFVTT